MARPVWSGTIAFGMVSIPIKLVPAVRRRTVSFNQLDRDTMSRIRYRKVSEATGEEVPADKIVRAASLGADRYVVVEERELDSLQPRRSHELAIETFLEERDIDPTRYDATYHVLPEQAPKPYALLAGALASAGRVGVGRFVMRQREYLAAIRSDGRRLQVSTLVFADEVVDTAGWGEFDVLEGVELSDRELSMAGTLVEAMAGDTAVLDSVDEYRAAVDALISAKAEGTTVRAEAAPERSANVVDLASALEASLEGARAAKGRHPSSRKAARPKAARTGKAQGAAEDVRPAKKPAARSRRAS